MPPDPGMGPAVGEAWFVLGVACQLLGKVADSGELTIATRSSCRLAMLKPCNNLGASLSNLRRPEEAEPCLRRALQSRTRLRPGSQ